MYLKDIKDNGGEYKSFKDKSVSSKVAESRKLQPDSSINQSRRISKNLSQIIKYSRDFTLNTGECQN